MLVKAITELQPLLKEGRLKPLPYLDSRLTVLSPQIVQHLLPPVLKKRSSRSQAETEQAAIIVAQPLPSAAEVFGYNRPVSDVGLSILQAGAERLGLSLDAMQLRQFGRYLRLIQEENERAALTTVSDAVGVQRRHFLESLAILAVLRQQGWFPPGAPARVIDVGSGAGLPGLPLKIAAPEWEVTLLEATGKKVQFLKRVIEELGLARVQAIHDRAETLAQDPAHREQYDLVTARAIAPLPALLELTLPFARLSGLLALPKGSALATELPAAQRALSILGGTVWATLPLPESPGLTLVLVRKTAPTPKRYPRRPGLPAKQPL